MMLHFFLFKCLREKQLVDYLKSTGNICNKSLPDEKMYVEYVNW